MFTGIVESLATVTAVDTRADSARLTIADPLLAGTAVGDSVAVDGVSLTIAAVEDSQVTVSLIPETLRRTTWGTKVAGDPVNVEVDIFAKYVERLVADSVERAVAGRFAAREAEGS